MRFQLVTQIDGGDRVFERVFGGAVSSGDLDRLDVAVAYATTSGVPKLMEAIGRDIPESRWVIGIDDGVSQPAAIERLRDTAGAEVRLASKGGGHRYHPKIYQLWSSTRPDMCVSYVGSGNFTASGLLRNAEAGAVMSAETVPEAEALRGQWRAFWDMGYPLTQAGLDLYSAAYNAVRAARATVDRAVREDILDEEAVTGIMAQPAEPGFDGMPQSATVAWLECGTASAGGRDLEFPRPMVPFFRLRGDRVEQALRVRGNRVFDLMFTMRQDNGMWRVLLSSDAITAATGRPNLRPVAGGTRSDLAIVFQRTPDAGADFDVRFVIIGSAEHDDLVQQTRAQGTLDRTRGAGGRNFGYY